MTSSAKPQQPPPAPSGPRKMEDITRLVVRKNAAPLGMADMYFALLSMRWRWFALLLVSVYLLANLVFATLYYLFGDIQNARVFSDFFFFSVQTWATIGYGGMTPQNLFSNALVSIEAFLGICGMAVVTSLFYAKFSKPVARILFANRAIVTTRDGRRVLMFRMANERNNGVVQASVSLTLLRDEVSAEGDRMRRVIDLPVVRHTQPMFILSWTVMHVIDEASPLWGYDAERLRREGSRITVSVMGHDASMAQTIHASHLYAADEVVFGARYVDINSPGPNGGTVMDYAKFHLIEEVPLPAVDVTARARG